MKKQEIKNRIEKLKKVINSVSADYADIRYEENNSVNISYQNRNT